MSDAGQYQPAKRTDVSMDIIAVFLSECNRKQVDEKYSEK
jgi:hypothetical protein